MGFGGVAGEFVVESESEEMGLAEAGVDEGHFVSDEDGGGGVGEAFVGDLPEFFSGVGVVAVAGFGSGGDELADAV